MLFEVPLLYSDLTLGQLITLQTENDSFKRVAACANISIEQLREASLNDVTKADKHLTTIAEMESGRHLKEIELNGQRYGFIPNWQEFTLGEWIDMEEYTENFWENAHKIMSILYRPIERQQGSVYTIAKYTAKEESEVFRQLPADLFGGCILFFLSSRKTLLHTIKSSLMKGAVSLTLSAINGGGIQPSIPSQVTSISKWKGLQSRVWEAYSRILRTSKTSTTN
jgi:hypothetical protein